MYFSTPGEGVLCLQETLPIQCKYTWGMGARGVGSGWGGVEFGAMGNQLPSDLVTKPFQNWKCHGNFIGIILFYGIHSIQ